MIVFHGHPQRGSFSDAVDKQVQHTLIQIFVFLFSSYSIQNCKTYLSDLSKMISAAYSSPTAWPNASYSEKMPRHIDPYWVIVWTLLITFIPRTKCSTGKLGQNGLIWPFLRSFWLFYGIRAFFFVYDCFFYFRIDANKYFPSFGYILG